MLKFKLRLTNEATTRFSRKDMRIYAGIRAIHYLSDVTLILRERKREREKERGRDREIEYTSSLETVKTINL